VKFHRLLQRAQRLRLRSALTRDIHVEALRHEQISFPPNRCPKPRHGVSLLFVPSPSQSPRRATLDLPRELLGGRVQRLDPRTLLWVKNFRQTMNAPPAVGAFSRIPMDRDFAVRIRLVVAHSVILTRLFPFSVPFLERSASPSCSVRRLLRSNDRSSVSRASFG
jgi:hypothetical protein